MKRIGTFIKLVKDPKKLFFVLLFKMKLRLISDTRYLKWLYYLRFNEKLCLDFPRSYNEKLQWMKIHDHNPQHCINVDKYEVRKMISSLIGNQYLIPLLGVYDDVEQILWDDLPNKFVIKCTHGSHCSIICKNKELLNIGFVKTQLKKWLAHNYYWDAREWPYKNIRPRIIIEQYISDKDDELIDYKFMCFSGEVKLILVHQNITNTSGKHTLDIFTPEWNNTRIEWGIPNSTNNIERPRLLSECIHIAEALSKDEAHVRVDLYIVDEHIYFGELTYYTAGGFKPFDRKADDLMIGEWLDLKGVQND